MNRLQQVITEVKEQPNLILFVDEAHTIVGAGSALGAPSDAANILKSVLARGEVRMIATTTLSEYKEHLQEHEVPARRFRSVYGPEPTTIDLGEASKRALEHARMLATCFQGSLHLLCVVQDPFSLPGDGSPTAAASLGSVAQSVAREAPCLVLLVPATNQ